MVSPLYAVFRDEAAAAQALQRLEAGGISRDAIHVFGPMRRPHAGSFADSGARHQHTPERDHVGSFADSGVRHQHTPERDHVGSFADSGDHHQHTPERDHVGNFAATTFDSDELEAKLILLHLPADAIAMTLAQLQAGAVVVVVQSADALVDAAAAALNG